LGNRHRYLKFYIFSRKSDEASVEKKYYYIVRSGMALVHEFVPYKKKYYANTVEVLRANKGIF
jgi:hypothetical protein